MSKVEKVYEVWVGGDMWDDQLSLEEAKAMAKEAFEDELKEHPDDKPDVVIDEHSYISIESLEDLETIGA